MRKCASSAIKRVRGNFSPESTLKYRIHGPAAKVPVFLEKEIYLVLENHILLFWCFFSCHIQNRSLQNILSFQ